MDFVVHMILNIFTNKILFFFVFYIIKLFNRIYFEPYNIIIKYKIYF